MPSVRPYKEKDKERVQKICLDNADCENASEDTKKYILIMYCNYYIEQEPHNCFVAVDDEDNAVGYIICAEDYDKYEETFIEKYLPQAAAISARRYVEAKLDLLTHSMFKATYAAHFHIDIADEYQRCGLGSLLIATLKAHLKKKNIPGVMLVCGEDNQQAINFYTKNGFKSLITTKFGKAMAIDFENR